MQLLNAKAFPLIHAFQYFLVQINWAKHTVVQVDVSQYPLALILVVAVANCEQSTTSGKVYIGIKSLIQIITIEFCWHNVIFLQATDDAQRQDHSAGMDNVLFFFYAS